MASTVSGTAGTGPGGAVTGAVVIASGSYPIGSSTFCAAGLACGNFSWVDAGSLRGDVRIALSGIAARPAGGGADAMPEPTIIGSSVSGAPIEAGGIAVSSLSVSLGTEASERGAATPGSSTSGSSGGGVSMTGPPTAAAAGGAAVDASGAATTASPVPPLRSATSLENRPKKSSAIFLAVPATSREPIWASLPPTSALAS